MTSSPITLNPVSAHMAIYISCTILSIGGFNIALLYLTDQTR